MFGFDKRSSKRDCGGRATPGLRLPTIAVLFVASLVATGCASLTPEECLNADWRAIGYEDGVAGRSMDRLGDHRSACAEVGVTPDFAAYQTGHRDGVRAFCHPANAYRLGRGGYAYTGICPGDLEPAFLDALGEGLFIYQLESDVDAVASEIGGVDYAIQERLEEIEDAEVALERDDLSDEERRRLRRLVRGLSREIGQLEAERGDLVAELRARERRLWEYLNAEGR